MAVVVGLIGAVGAAGVLVLSTAWTQAAVRKVGGRRDWNAAVRPVVAAVIAGSLALLLSGWVAAGVAGAVGGYVATRSWLRRGATSGDEQQRITALASWCEQLRDLLSAEHGIVGTIAATSRTCPEPIRDEVTRLATRLSRQRPANAVRQFADELDDPSGDLVASVLLMAMSRSSRTSELLSELAVTIRDRAAMRLRVEADRAGQRSEARFVVAFSATVIVGALVFGRNSDFLDAYDDATGQLVLAVVFAMFAYGGWWMAHLTRFDRPARFLTVGEVE